MNSNMDDVKREAPTEKPCATTEDVLLMGWLKEVNWSKGTAQLHGCRGAHAELKFDQGLGEDMRRFATEFVRIRGRGQLDPAGMWGVVDVTEITGPRIWGEPFDAESFRNNPNPKVFDPDKIVGIDLTDEEWEVFDRATHEGRGQLM